MQGNKTDHYAIQEGMLEFPDGFSDRTVNLFTKGKPGAAFALNIARDVAGPNEELSDYVQRQIGILKSNLKKYEVKKHNKIQVGQQQIPGEYVEATYMAETRKVWQRQAAIQVGEHILIFTATHASAFNQQQHTLWEQWLHSFKPWPREKEPGHV